MLNFTYENPTRILFGADTIGGIATEIPAQARILVTYGGGSAIANGTLDQVRQALAGRVVHEFGGIEANPRYETLMRAVELGRRDGIDFLLAVGGGSVADGTKFIAAAIPFAGEPWDIVASHAPLSRAVPLGVVLTLPATGSESNTFAVISRQSSGDKLGFGHPLVRPRFAVLDPTRTMTLPPRQVANGIVDAFTHVMEQYLTYPVNAAIQDRFAEGILATLIEVGPKTLADPQDYDARANLMWAATQALSGLIGAGVPHDWATHMIGHEITGAFGLDHAQTLAVVLPAMMRARRAQKRDKLLQYATRVWGLDAEEGDTDGAIDAAIARTRAFFESLGVKTRLGAYGLGEEAVATVLRRLTDHQMTALGERGDLGVDEVRDILVSAL